MGASRLPRLVAKQPPTEVFWGHVAWVSPGYYCVANSRCPRDSRGNIGDPFLAADEEEAGPRLDLCKVSPGGTGQGLRPTQGDLA